MKKKTLLILYFSISFLWIFASNYVIEELLFSHHIWLISRAKEIVYILITGSFFYIFIKKQEELTSSQEDKKRLSTLINSMVDFVNFKDGEGRWIEANHFGLRLFQIDHVDYRGKKDSELAEYSPFYSEALRSCEISDEETWKKGKICRVEEVIPLPNGKTKTFDTVKVPLFYPDGTRKGLVIIGRDITALREAEERLRNTEKLSVVGELAASVAHEIRNPLTSLKGFVQLLQKEDPKHPFYYQIMLDELNRINHIVSELLLLAKPQDIKFSKEDLRRILFDVISLLNPEASLCDIQINFTTSDHEIWIDCEPNQLKQMFINIIKNAIEASEKGSSVNVYLKENQKNATIIIEDFGSGISEERLEKIGEPFYSSKEKGTGLGLTVSFKIVQAHDGSIRFQSVQNKGTTVSIELPIHHKG
ncbi:ATP-binding protein [Pseudoneobacillus sp. C159]